MKRKIQLLMLLIVIIFSVLFSTQKDVNVNQIIDLIEDFAKDNKNLEEKYSNKDSQDSDKDKEIVYENIKISNFENNNLEVYFCPDKVCEDKLNYYLNSSKESIYCAFYDLDLEDTINILNKKFDDKNVKVELVVDDANIPDSLNFDVFSDKDRGTRYNNYMHHKFCVIDNKTLITGSMNPTENGVYKNNNNLIILHSVQISQNYLKEFNLLKDNNFGYNKENFEKYEISNSDLGVSVESYFCPQDDCRGEILEELQKAEKSIYFASFVFTDDVLSEFLYNSSHKFEVRGIIEKRMINSQGSDFDLLKNFTVIDNNKYTMHHKFFIVDNETVITGSMNPSNSGINYNDENIFIVKNLEFASLFVQEFEKMRG